MSVLLSSLPLSSLRNSKAVGWLTYYLESNQEAESHIYTSYDYSGIIQLNLHVSIFFFNCVFFVWLGFFFVNDPILRLSSSVCLLGECFL